MNLLNELQAIEERFQFRFPHDFISRYPTLCNSALDSDVEQFQLLMPSEMILEKRSVIHPDLIPIILTDDGDSYCLLMSLPGKEERCTWVFCEREENVIAPLGRSFDGCLRAFLLHVEDRAHSSLYSCEPRERVSLMNMRQSIFELFQELRVGLFDVLDPTQVVEPYYGLAEKPYLACAKLVSPQITIPYYVVQDAQVDLSFGRVDDARGKWQNALREGPGFGSLSWSLGLLAAAEGDVENAVRYYAEVAEGDWTTNGPVALCGGGAWCALPKYAESYLRLHPEEYEQASNSLHIRTCVLNNELDDPTLWTSALSEAVAASDYWSARAIALSGTTAQTWHPGYLKQECVRSLVRIYKAVGFASRVEHLL